MTFYNIQSIQNKIYEIRGERVMLDRDLAILYEVETRIVNQYVKRNLARFPSDFMFQLTREEYDAFRFEIEVVGNKATSLRSQIVILETGRGKYTKYLPYAFTEQGVAMLSSILTSTKAIAMNIHIMRAFVEIRKTLLMQNDLKEQFKEIRLRLGEHDAQLNEIYQAIENLLDEKIAQRRWEEREMIGFRK